MQITRSPEGSHAYPFQRFHEPLPVYATWLLGHPGRRQRPRTTYRYSSLLPHLWIRHASGSHVVSGALHNDHGQIRTKCIYRHSPTTQGSTFIFITSLNMFLLRLLNSGGLLFQPTYLFLVPPLMTFLVSQPDVSAKEFESVTGIMAAAAPYANFPSYQLF